MGSEYRGDGITLSDYDAIECYMHSLPGPNTKLPLTFPSLWLHFIIFQRMQQDLIGQIRAIMLVSLETLENVPLEGEVTFDQSYETA
jgi:hypothetical protein